jgi:drug/metabolite transporter (DMT)-like permease
VDLAPALIGLCGGLGAGIAYTMVRYLSQKGERSPYIVFFFSGFSCLVVLPWMLTHYQPMTWGQLGWLLCAGLAAAGGQFGITAAYSYAPAREVSVYDYTQVIFAALLGWILFRQTPDIWSLVGYVVICGAGVGMFLYNNRPHRQEGRA